MRVLVVFASGLVVSYFFSVVYVVDLVEVVVFVLVPYRDELPVRVFHVLLAVGFGCFMW